jgi:putative ABC transport system permease protein
MEFGPIMSAMRRNKVGAILIAVQMAITLAILCNALFIIEQRVALSKRPSGADEANVFIMDNQWVGNPPDASARLQGDLAALRSLPGVQDAFATNSFPMSGGGSTEGIRLHPDQKDSTALTALYFGDEHAIAGFGLKLVAGRNFNAGDVVDKLGYTDLKGPTGIIMTLRRSSYRPNAHHRDCRPVAGTVDLGGRMGQQVQRQFHHRAFQFH